MFDNNNNKVQELEKERNKLICSLTDARVDRQNAIAKLNEIRAILDR